MPLQFVIAMVASAINDRMQRRLVYLEEEVTVLRQLLESATGTTRLRFTPEQRRRLAVAGKALTPAERKACCRVVSPATILAWFRELAARKYDGSKVRRQGRPGKPEELRALVVRMATENPGWGYTKLRDALRTGLKVEVSRTTVANILAQAGLEPAPERTKKRRWKSFLKAHWETLYACDFFAVEARYLVFFVMHVACVTGLLERGGVKVVRIPAQSPNCNPHAERFVRTIRQECLEQFVIFGERHLRHLVREFVAHYQRERFHQGLGGQLVTPAEEPINDNGSPGAVRRRSRLGGVLNFHHRGAA
jgi:transposase